MNKRLWRHSFAAAAVAFFLAFASGGVAHADPDKDGITDTWTAAKGQLKKQDVLSGPTTTQTMHITGFDEKVANDNGYEIIKDANGKAVGSKKKGEITTNANIIWGKCGESHVYYNATGGGWTTATTGFTLYNTPLSMGWTVAVVDNAGVASRRWSMPWFWSSWQDTFTSWHSVNGYSYAYVSEGWVLLNSGSICTTGSPSDDAIVYW